MRARTATNRAKVCCATITLYSILPHRCGAVEPLNLDYESLSGVDRAGLEPAWIAYIALHIMFV